MNVWVKSHPKYKVWSESDCQAFARDVSDRICKSTVQLETQIAFAERSGNLLINSVVPTILILALTLTLLALLVFFVGKRFSFYAHYKRHAQ